MGASLHFSISNQFWVSSMFSTSPQTIIIQRCLTKLCGISYFWGYIWHMAGRWARCQAFHGPMLRPIRWKPWVIGNKKFLAGRNERQRRVELQIPQSFWNTGAPWRVVEAVQSHDCFRMWHTLWIFVSLCHRHPIFGVRYCFPNKLRHADVRLHFGKTQLWDRDSHRQWILFVFGLWKVA